MDSVEQKEYRHRFSIVFVLGIAFALRVWGIDHGLPYVYLVDERIMVTRSLGFGTGDLNPHFFHWPGTAVMYSLFGLYGVHYVLGKMLGCFGGPVDFARSFFENPSSFYLIGRFFTAAASVFMVWLVYCSAVKVTSRRGALAAALFTATMPLLVGIAHLVITDTPLTLAAAAICLIALKLAEQPLPRYYFYGGALVGLAVGVKYNGAALMLPMVVAHLVARRNTRGNPRLMDRRIAYLCAGAVAAFLIVCPFALLDWPTFSDHLKWQIIRVHDIGSFGGMVKRAWAFYLIRGFPEATGIVVYGLALVGLVVTALRRKILDIVWLSFPLAYLAYISTWQVGITKYLAPALPFAAVAAGIGLEKIARLLKLNGGKLTMAVLAVLCAMPGGLISAKENLVRSATDTRTEAKRWIEKNVRAGIRIALDSGRFDLAHFSPPLEDKPENLKRLYMHYDVPEWRASQKQIKEYAELMTSVVSSRGPAYDLVRVMHYSDGQVSPNAYLDRLLAQEVRYVVTSGYAEEGYNQPGFAKLYPRTAEDYRRYYNEVRERGKLVARFEPQMDERPGPLIEIYELPDQGSAGGEGAGSEILNNE